MSKAVLISIQPKWCELIASGKKTVEVRKTIPKIKTPFKCYIYCTKDNTDLVPSRIWWKADKTGFQHIMNGKVIGEFVCNHITDIKPFGFDDIEEFEKQCCLGSADIVRYLKGFYGYGWHISDLKIYDKPKELREFYNLCHSDCNDCEYKSVDYSYGGDEDIVCTVSNKKPIKRPPQSWCYVEEL